jgi:hypothetical protein
MMKTILCGVLAATGTALVCACSGDDKATASADGGASDAPTTNDGALAMDGPAVTDGGLRSFTAPADPGPGGILFAASGEVLALTGYPFPPVNDGDPAFVDGWDVHFTRLLVTVDKIKLSANADLSPGDQSQTGAVVAEVDGPWAIDLAHSDPSYLAGKGGPGEEAAPIAALSNQNRVGGTPAFATDGTRYAFGFDVIQAAAATADGRRTANVNLDADGLADYQAMIADGCGVLYVGSATFKGGTVAGHTDCNSDPEYANWPKTVNFRLCFNSPATYVNCQNPDNDPATPFPNEEHERGIAFKSGQSVVGQITIHTDHPFWDSVLHDSPAHFDQFAARVAGQGIDAAAVTPTVTVALTRGVDYTSYTDALGNKLKWRYCIAPPTDVHPQFNGPMAFDPQSVPHCTGSDPSTGLCDYEDFTTYDQSTQGHLDSDGLCFVKRNYPSPP